jgi:hypothetical protein
MDTAPEIRTLLAAVIRRHLLDLTNGSSGQRAGSDSSPHNASSSAEAVIATDQVLRQRCGGLLTMAASSNPTAACCISELTLSTRRGRSTT